MRPGCAPPPSGMARRPIAKTSASPISRMGTSGEDGWRESSRNARTRTSTPPRRVRRCPLSGPGTWIKHSLPFEFHILVRRRVDVASDESDPRLLHPGPHAIQGGVLPDRRDHHLLVQELLDAVQDRLALLRIELACLLPKEPVDVGIAAVNVGAASNHQGLESRGRVSGGDGVSLDETSVLLLDPQIGRA